MRSEEAENVIKMIAGFTSVQFLLLSFRSGVAYNRWWEGGTLLQKTRGEWFNAYSSLIAFSSTLPEMAGRVEEFHHLLARLMSLLFCAGLQQVSPNQNRAFEIIDTRGIDSISLDFLSEAPDKAEVLLQWIQRSTVLNMQTGVLTIAPPILSRAFQEISRGIVNLQNARKIADFPFPFAYAQVSVVMLLVHYVTCPITASLLIADKHLAALASFLVIFVLWSINFIALQLEYPFGERDNDLPMLQFQKDWNKSLATLLAKRAQHPPIFNFDVLHHRKIGLIMSDGSPIGKVSPHDDAGLYQSVHNAMPGEKINESRGSRTSGVSFVSKTLSAVSRTLSHASRGTKSSNPMRSGRAGSKDARTRPSVRNFRGSTIDPPGEESQALDGARGQRTDKNVPDSCRQRQTTSSDSRRTDRSTGQGSMTVAYTSYGTRSQGLVSDASDDFRLASRMTGYSVGSADDNTFVVATGPRGSSCNASQNVEAIHGVIPLEKGTLNASVGGANHRQIRKPQGERIPPLCHGDDDVIDFSSDDPASEPQSRAPDSSGTKAEPSSILKRLPSNVSEAHRQAAMRSKNNQSLTRNHSDLSRYDSGSRESLAV